MPDTSPPIRPLRGLRRLTPEELSAEARGVRSARDRKLPARLSMPAVLSLAHLWGVPGDGQGSVLNALSRGNPVGRDALLEDVRAVIAHCERTRPASMPEERDVDVMHLRLLADWVETQP